LGDSEVKELWKATDIDGPFPALLRFILLTGCRRSEGAGLRWDELTGHEWLLPASRHKNKKVDLLRPLSDRALAIVNAQPRIGDSPYVFTNDGKRPIAFGGGTRRFLSKFSKGWTPHDLRRTARTLLSRAQIDSDIAEKCLGHLPSGLRDTYDQYKYQPELSHAFAELAALVERIADPPPSIVTPIRGRKRNAAQASA
jgi:integrase